MLLGSSKFCKTTSEILKGRFSMLTCRRGHLLRVWLCSCLQSFARPVQQFAHFRFSCGNKSNTKKWKPKALLQKQMMRPNIWHHFRCEFGCVPYYILHAQKIGDNSRQGVVATFSAVIVAVFQKRPYAACQCQNLPGRYCGRFSQHCIDNTRTRLNNDQTKAMIHVQVAPDLNLTCE